MKKILKYLDDHTEEIILMFLMVAIVVVMSYQIIRRYVFNNSLSWSEEFCRYCFIWFMFIGYSYSIKEKLDLRMDAVVVMLPKFIQKILSLVVWVAGFALTVLLFVNSFGAVQKVIETGEKSVGLQVPMWAVYISMILGFGMAIIRYIQKFINDFIRKTDDKEVTE